MQPAEFSGQPLVLCGLLQAGAVLFCARRAADAQDRIGTPVHVVAPSRGKRLFADVLLIAVTIAALLGPVPGWPALLVLVQALLLARLLPATEDSVLGERGVRSGWESRAFGELEEWLLVGEHLRWRLRGEWYACAAPAALHPGLRGKLDPARESPHGHAGLDQGRISTGTSS